MNFLGFIQTLSFLDVITTDKKIIVLDLNSGFKDLEDALQNYSAERSRKIDVIITRNIKDYKNSSLRVMTPSEYIQVLK